MGRTDGCLSRETYDLLRAEVWRAHQKHGKMSMLNPGVPTLLKLAALIEEVGEVGKELTYDNDNGREALIKELVQTANVALSWVESLRPAEPAETDDELLGMWSTADYTGGPDDTTNERLRDAYEHRTGDDS